jgi:hypothetical protein
MNTSKQSKDTQDMSAAPSGDDAAALRAAIHKLTTGTRVIDAAVAWINNVLSRVPPGDGQGYRFIAGFRVQRPQGTLKSIRVMAGGGDSDLDLTIERIGLSARGQPTDPLVVIEGATHPLSVAVQKSTGQELYFAGIPIRSRKSIYGAMFIGYKRDDMAADIPVRCLRIAAKLIEDQLSKYEGPGVQTVLSAVPRATTGVEDFLGQVDLLLAFTSKNGPGIGICAFALRCREKDELGTVKRMVHQVAQRALDLTRTVDLVTIVGHDTILIAMPKASERTCRDVAERLRRQSYNNIPAVARAGVATLSLDATARLSLETLERLAEQARRNAPDA